jgi:hypothetical protein
MNFLTLNTRCLLSGLLIGQVIAFNLVLTYNLAHFLAFWSVMFTVWIGFKTFQPASHVIFRFFFGIVLSLAIDLLCIVLIIH